jgi:sporulation protein YlmC with PRC-barrel domain
MLRPNAAIFFCVLVPLATSALAASGTSTPMTPLSASSVLGDTLDDENGWQIAQIDDLLIDSADNTIVFAVIRVGGRFEAPKDPVALGFPDPSLSVANGTLRTTQKMRDLGRLPSIADALEGLDAEKRKRLVSVDDLIGAPLISPSAVKVGEVEDVVLRPSEGLLGEIIVALEAQGSRRVIAKPQIRSGGGPEAQPQVVIDDARLQAAPRYESSFSTKVELTWRRIARRIGLD